MSTSRGKRPKQGTSRIQAPMAKQEAMLLRAVDDLVVAAEMSSVDPDIAALGVAKADRDDAEIGRLIGILKERYGAGKELLRLFKSL